jgi:phosphatidylserine/phosphatidylglycerophosphate/cardiolipin synthase-like enzyme
MTITDLDYVLLATGFTGALTLQYLLRKAWGYFVAPPSLGLHFSPKGGCTEAVVAELRKARREILVQAYGFTSQPIAQALVDAKQRGVEVEILLDHSNEKEPHTDLPLFLEKGLITLIDAHHAIAHNKIMIIDRRTVLTGSFNFTNQAEHENLVVIKGHSDVAATYREQFELHKTHCRPVQGKPVATVPRKAA